MSFWKSKDSNTSEEDDRLSLKAKKKMTPAQRRSTENAEQFWKTQARIRNTGKGTADHSKHAYDDYD